MGLPIVEGDLTQIRQIIMNLVLNGAEATEGKAGVIRVTTGVMDADAAYLATTHLSPDLPEGRYVFLEVADNGRGMSPDTLARIFDPFFSTKFTGRGLGLAAVLGIVRGHNGALKVESHEDVGTTFRLLLPASTVVAGAETTVVEPAPIWHGRGLALVVDDEPSVRHVATRMLVSMGLDVETAASGAEAAEILNERPAEFTIVLLDLTMPGSRGDETYRVIRAIRADVPVILMSGYSHQEASTLFEGEELAGFLQKPFRLERLRELVRGATATPSAAEATLTAGRRLAGQASGRLGGRRLADRIGRGDGPRVGAARRRGVLQDRQQELGQPIGQRLVDHGGEAELAHVRLVVRPAGHHHHRHAGSRLPPLDLDTEHLAVAARHVQIGQHEIGRRHRHPCQRLEPVARLEHVESTQAQACARPRGGRAPRRRRRARAAGR